MSRPEFLSCVMTSNIINSIRQAQEVYDSNPERWERLEEEKRQEKLQEEQELENLRYQNEHD